MSTSSTVASHCSVFALSDSTDADLQQRCDHDHNEVCERCESLQSTLDQILRAVEEASFPTEDDKDEASYLATSATLAIHQDQARLDVIDDPEAVFIFNDWAMNFFRGSTGGFL